MSKNEKGEFLSKVEAFAKELSEMTDAKGMKRGFAILAGESAESESGTKMVVAACGNGEQIVAAVASFATQDETRPLFSEGLKVAAVKSLCQKLGGGILN